MPNRVVSWPLDIGLLRKVLFQRANRKIVLANGVGVDVTVT